MKRHKCYWNIDRRIYEKVRKESRRRSRSVGVIRGMQTATVEKALVIGLRELEKERV